MKLMKKLLCLTLVAVAAVTVAACDDEQQEDATYTFNTYTLLTPSNWNELTYQDNNDTEILSYISSSFFGFDYKFDEQGNIVKGDFTLQYSAATKLEDVTTVYAGNEKYAVPADADKGYAYKITLRDDLKWENGDAITAADFVYTMKEQLNPLFKNYRADSFYNSTTVIHGAKDYVFQGDSGWFGADTAYAAWDDSAADKIIFNVGNTAETKALLGLSDEESAPLASLRASVGFPESYDAAAVAAYLVEAYGAPNIASLQGKKISEIKADTTLNAILEDLIVWWDEGNDGILDFGVAQYTFPAVDFSEVGIFQGATPQELIIVLDAPLTLLKEDGSLAFSAGYDFSGLPLVHKATYEAQKHEPAEGSTLWTTTYNQSVESTMSWGPYKLTYFQATKQYILEKNEHWYGWNMERYEGQYQADKIVCEQVADWNTAWLKFQKGEVDSIGIDVSIAADYKNSEQAIFTPDDFVGLLQLQSNAEALKERQSAGKNKMLLSYPEFRKALSLGINRADYTATCTTSSKAGFGLFNSMHYYDVENGGVYRNEDVAKQVLCNVYGVDSSKFESLTQAEASITGYDLTQARQLIDAAVDKAIADGNYNGTDKVEIEFGTGAISESVERQFGYIKSAWEELFKGTKLEGKLEMKLTDFAKAWANDFRAGAYDVCMGGWTGAAWNPGYFLLAYLDPGYMYSAAWDTSNHLMEFTLTGEGENGTDVTLELGLLEWYAILNGKHGSYSNPRADKVYNWAEGFVPNEKRLALIAALEEVILSQYYTVPLQNSFGASLISYKWDYISRDYHTFMGYGGIRYIKFNYTDAEWAKFVEDQNGQINYKD